MHGQVFLEKGDFCLRRCFTWTNEGQKNGGQRFKSSKDKKKHINYLTKASTRYLYYQQMQKKVRKTNSHQFLFFSFRSLDEQLIYSLIKYSYLHIALVASVFHLTLFSDASAVLNDNPKLTLGHLHGAVIFCNLFLHIESN